MKNIYIIEHLEPKLWPWCLIEYKHISEIAGKNNLWFTSIKKQDIKKLKKYGKIFTKSIKDIKIENSCILDPDAKNTLTFKDSKKFKYLIFGGILGDYPPRKRTKSELSIFFKNTEKRNIGKNQLSTDNAVYVVNQICKGKRLKDIKFQDEVEIIINDIESTILPYKYPIVNGKPNISQELVRYLKKH